MLEPVCRTANDMANWNVIMYGKIWRIRCLKSPSLETNRLVNWRSRCIVEYGSELWTVETLLSCSIESEWSETLALVQLDCVSCVDCSCIRIFLTDYIHPVFPWIFTYFIEACNSEEKTVSNEKDLQLSAVRWWWRANSVLVNLATEERLWKVGNTILNCVMFW